MTIDFNKLAAAQQISSLLSPRDVFNALPKSPGYGYLRDVQGQVLDAWEKRRSERDVSIKMNTGTGKTIVGLLILRSCLNENVVPALFVTPDIYLAQQVITQAEKLGIRTTEDPDSTQYLSGQAVGVVNVAKLMNGRSVFGGPGSRRPTPVPIGVIVIDDAHAALAATEAQSTLTIPSSNEAYRAVLHEFHDTLRRQSETALLDIEAGEPSAVLRVPFWSWADKTSEVARILHEHRDDEELRFELPLIADVLATSQAVFTADALQIKPGCPPIRSIRSFAQATRRVYLTATLADDSVLVTHFDADPGSVADAITPGSAADLGDRLILAPQEINPAISEDEVIAAVRSIATHVNTVVLVPSYRRAALWADVADITTGADGIADAVARLQREHVGLVVLVNKYDGIDLPDDACRLLVIDGLPEAYGGIERREATLLSGTNAMIGRQLQRVEQGMGRGVRSADDSCVVLLLGARLSQLIANPSNAAKLGPATRAQLTLSRQVAAQLDGRPLNELLGVVRQALDRDPGWVAASRSALTGVTYGEGTVSEVAVHRRHVENLTAIRDYAGVCDAMSAAVNAAMDDRVKGWLQEELAVLTQQIDPVKAQRVLAGALRSNPRVLRPIEGVSYRRLSSVADQGTAASEYLSTTYSDAHALVLGINSVLDDLAFDPDKTEDFEAAMESLGQHLGFTANRPERDVGNGPDVLWSTGERRYVVIECKSGATVDRLWRRDVAQLAHSMNWFSETYDGGSARPMIVHPANRLERNAIAPSGTRILTDRKLNALRDAVRAYGVALAHARCWSNARAVAEQLRQHRLTGGEFLEAHTVTPERDR